MGGTSDDQARVAPWRHELDVLEAALDRAEALLRGERDVAPEPEWTPSLTGTLPAELVERARALNRRQLELTARLAGSLERVGAELTAAVAATTQHQAGSSSTTPPLFFDGRA